MLLDLFLESFESLILISHKNCQHSISKIHWGLIDSREGAIFHRCKSIRDTVISMIWQILQLGGVIFPSWSASTYSYLYSMYSWWCLKPMLHMLLLIFPPAMKIHISAECKVALDSLGGWITEPRGPIDIKVSEDLQSFIPECTFEPYISSNQEVLIRTIWSCFRDAEW